MPHAWRSGRNGKHRRYYIESAKRYRLPWFDGFAFNERLYEIEPKLSVHGYIQTAHVALPIARILGRCLARALSKLGDDRNSRGINNTWETRTLNAADVISECRTVHRQTRVDSRTLVAMRPGDRITFRARPGDEVVGVALNGCESNAIVRVIADTARSKDLQNYLYRVRAYTAVSWAFGVPIPISGDSVDIECLDRSLDIVADELNDQMIAGPDLSDPHLEIAGLIVRRRRRRAVWHILPKSIDLVQSLSDEEIGFETAEELAELAAA